MVHILSFFRACASSIRHIPLIALLLLAACAAAPPVQEMSDARQAVAAAREAGAERFAGAKLREAESLLASAEGFLQASTANAYWMAKRAAIDAKDIALEALLTSRRARETGQAP